MWTALAVVIVAWALFAAFNYFYTKQMIKRNATVLTSEEFEAQMHGQQVIDIRQPAEYKAKHVLGARNIHYPNLMQNASAIRKDKPVFFYDSNAQAVSRLVKKLKKQGYNDMYVLKGGFNEWTGKTK